MRRLQILMDEELDDALEHAATARGLSKSELIRDAVRRMLGEEAPRRPDALWESAGIAFEADGPGLKPEDEAILGRKASVGRRARA